jgi:hypothetical protein
MAMLWIVGIIALFVVLSLSLALVRLATVALTMTGLSTQAASFQARSAFTGTGFTTSEAEAVVDHPVRRRIISWLMLLQSARFFGDTRDYSRLLHLSGEYMVTEVQIGEGDWLAGKQLSECRLRDEGMLILGVVREDGSYVGVPRPARRGR